MNMLRCGLWMAFILTIVSATAAYARGDNGPRPARVLHFPSGRSVGSVGIHEIDPTQEFRFSLDGWHMWQGPSTHVEARGNVTVPENRMVVLHISGKHIRNLSWLARLGPDDVDALRFEPTSPQFNLPVAGDEAMPHIARLTGLRELDIYFTDITDKGLEHLARLQNLEKLTLPQDITDVGFAVVARLPRLEVLSGLGYGVTRKSADLLARITTLEELSLRRHQMADDDLVCLARLPRLRALSLWGYDLTDAGLVHLQNIPSLKSLDVSGMDITDAGAAQLAKVTQIEELNVHNTLLTNRGMAHLADLPALKKLTLDGMGENRIQITDEGMVSIGSMASLEYLHLPSRQNTITDAGIAHLADLKRLNYLWAGGSSNSPLTDVAIEHIAHLASLKTLKIGGKHITDDGLARLTRLTALQNLSLFYVGPITDVGLAHLANLRRLRKLWVQGSDGSMTVLGLNQLNVLSDLTHLELRGMRDRRDGSVLRLSGLTELEELILPGVHLTDDDLATLAGLHRLQRLNIDGHFTREGLSHLTDLPRLRLLGISGSGLTDEELSCLAECQALWRLGVQGSFTDRGLLALARCGSLRLLFIESDKPFSRRAIAQLQNRNPPINVMTKGR